MNVLFAGGWDMVGAYLADRLIIEGNHVCWVTGDDTHLLWNKRFKGSVYCGQRSREEYLRILRSNSVDVIVFMTAPLRENFEEFPEYESQIGELTDLLNVLRSYPVKSLVYLSSLELDYPDLYTPVLTDLAAGEMLCQAYHKTFELPVLILRLGCVYGSFARDRMGYTGRTLNALKRQIPLSSFYSEDSLLDTAYGEDAAQALYLLLTLGKQGLYRLFSGHPLTFGEYFSLLGQAAKVRPSVRWTSARRSPERDFFLSERSVNLETGWMPITLLQEKGLEALRKTLRDSSQEIRPRMGSRFFKSVKKCFLRKSLRNLAETLAAFGVTCLLLNFSQDVSDLKYVDIRLMFVAVISALYGLKLGLLSIGLATASYLYSLLAARIDITYFLYSVDTWIPFVIYGVAGTSIGYITDRRRDEYDSLQENHRLLEEKYEFLKSIHGETLDIKGKLQKQILTSKYSFGYAYEVAVKLDSLKPELIILKVISILEHIMDCKKAAIFLLGEQNTRFARLKVCSAELRDIVPSSLEMEKYPRIQECFSKKETFINTALEAGYPDYAAPLFAQDRPFAFIAIYDIGADKFTVYFQNLFRIITNLIEQNLAKALKYERLKKDSMYYPGTALLYPKAFQERLNIMLSESDDIAYSFILAKVYPVAAEDRTVTAGRIAGVIRGSDCMGVDADGDYAVILVNMKAEYLDNLKERFRRAGLTLEVVTEP